MTMNKRGNLGSPKPPSFVLDSFNIISPQIRTLCKNVYTSKNNMISSQTNIFNKLIDDLAEKSYKII